MQLSPQQEDAIRKVDNWFKNETKFKPFFYLAGYAGTGKSTLAKYFSQDIDGEVLNMAYTGKAAYVMTQKGSPASTIHSMIYKLVKNKETKKDEFVLNRNSAVKGAKLIIVDEVSMVNKEIALDLLYFGVPILVLGDPGQLPPVKGSGYFTSSSPDAMLTEIHRQAQGNPIIELATRARKGLALKPGQYGESIVSTSLKMSDAAEVDQVLVGRINTKEMFNRQIRKAKGYSGLYPEIGEKLICLKNERSKGILNGQTFTLSAMITQGALKKSRFLHSTVESDMGALIEVKIPKGYFDPAEPIDEYVLKNGSQFELGHALTVHKSQGSEWNSVLVYDESYCFRDDAKKWLYTAITRASERLVLVRD